MSASEAQSEFSGSNANIPAINAAVGKNGRIVSDGIREIMTTKEEA